MRFILILSLLIAAPPSVAQTQRYFEETQELTRDVPSGNPRLMPASPIKPLLLTGWTSYRLTVCPEEGESLLGGGWIRLYLYHPYIMGAGRWGYREELDQKLTNTNSGVNMCQVFGLRVDVRQGYLHPAAVDVEVSGGSTVVVRIDPDNF